jgi:hypothetical protein
MSPGKSYCSFCGKLHSQVRILVAKKGGASICNECIALSCDISFDSSIKYPASTEERMELLMGLLGGDTKLTALIEEVGPRGEELMLSDLVLLLTGTKRAERIEKGIARLKLRLVDPRWPENDPSLDTTRIEQLEILDNVQQSLISLSSELVEQKD